EPKPPAEPEPVKAADKTDKKSKAKKKEPTTWKDAMGEVYTSMQNASSEDEFRKLDWVTRISGESAKAATRLRDQRDWKEAYVLFELLRLTFPDNEGYKRESRDCRLHAHFEAFYTTKGEWKRELKNIDPSVVREILGRASQDYVR